MLVIGAKVT